LAIGRHDVRIIDDSANATPESLQQALETLRALPSRRRIAVLGDIANLGRATERLHREVGRQAAQTANMLIAVGEHMRTAGREALQRGIDVHHFDTPDDAGKWLADFLRAEDTVLVSGGREMQLGRLVERLVSQAESV
jgi:UDP-N-acetylmuramyl pentapeptide synthase